MVSADYVLAVLREGNDRYVAHCPEHPNVNQDRRTATASDGQAPLVAMLSCSDSRVPVERIFDRGIGDIFSIRVAGNVLGRSGLASLEYAVSHLQTPLIMVLGHTNCGAVTAVLQSGLLTGSLRSLSEKILPAVERARRANPHASESELLHDAVRYNIWKVIEDLFATSICLRQDVLSGRIKVVGAMYDIHTGKVEWMGTHPNQEELAA